MSSLLSLCGGLLGVASSLQFGAVSLFPRQQSGGVTRIARSSQQTDQLEWAAREAALLEEELLVASSIEEEEEEEDEEDEEDDDGSPELLGTLSLYEIPEVGSEAAELLEAAEEALQASASIPTSWPARRNALWDRMFWDEYYAGRDPSPRIQHFLRVHRIVSLALSGRNRTDFVCRPSPDLPTIEGENRVATALTFCAGLTSRTFWDVNVCPSWIADVDASKYLKYFDAAHDEFCSARRKIVFPGLVTDERTDEFLAEDQGSEKDLMTTATGQFGELVEVPPDSRLDLGSIDDDDALAASFRELDALDDDDGFFDDGLLIEDDDDEDDSEERSAHPEEEQVDPERHGRRLVDLVAYFRQDPGIVEDVFGDAGIPTDQRRISIVSQAPGTSTPFLSEMENMFLTCYKRLEGSPQNCGIRSTTADSVDDVVVIDPTFKHAIFNDGDETAFWLKVDLWHPDLQASEIDDLQAFLALDEQFLLRRYVGDSLVLEKLFSTESYLDYIP